MNMIKHTSTNLLNKAQNHSIQTNSSPYLTSSSNSTKKHLC